MPCVSILMPVKNAGLWLNDSLQSIVDQSFTDWELIAVDDNSSDNSLELLRNWEANYENIIVFENTGVGILPALKIAFEKSTGEYITRMDADDKMPIEKLELFINKLSNHGKDSIVTGLVKYFSSQKISPGYLKYENWLNNRVSLNDHWKNVYRECVIASANWMTHRKNIFAIGGFESLNYPEDYDMVLRWAQLKLNILPINSVTHHWREHPERTSRKSENYQQKAFFNLKLDHFLQHVYNNDKTLVVWGDDTKGKLTASILQQSNTEFVWMSLKSNNKDITNRGLVNFKSIEKLKQPQLLITVFPNEELRQEIDTYLNNLGLYFSQDYWYL